MIKFFVAAALLAVSVTASAQFTNYSKGGSSSAVNTNGWGTFYLQWNPSSFKTDAKGADDQSFTGFSVGYNQAFSISKNTPLYVEAGAALQCSYYSEDLEDDEIEYTQKFNMFSAKIPVSLMYKFDLPNSNVSLVPLAGVDFRINFSGKIKNEVSYEDDYYYYELEEEYDPFDKKDMGKSNVWDRLQIGWHIGVNAHFGENWLLGLSYGSDFSEIAKKVKISTTSVTLGYRF